MQDSLNLIEPLLKTVLSNSYRLILFKNLSIFKMMIVMMVVVVVETLELHCPMIKFKVEYNHAHGVSLSMLFCLLFRF